MREREPNKRDLSGGVKVRARKRGERDSTHGRTEMNNLTHIRLGLSSGYVHTYTCIIYQEGGTCVFNLLAGETTLMKYLL